MVLFCEQMGVERTLAWYPGTPDQLLREEVCRQFGVRTSATRATRVPVDGESSQALPQANGCVEFTVTDEDGDQLVLTTALPSGLRLRVEFKAYPDGVVSKSPGRPPTKKPPLARSASSSSVRHRNPPTPATPAKSRAASGIGDRKLSRAASFTQPRERIQLHPATAVLSPLTSPDLPRSRSTSPRDSENTSKRDRRQNRRVSPRQRTKNSRHTIDPARSPLHQNSTSSNTAPSTGAHQSRHSRRRSSSRFPSFSRSKSSPDPGHSGSIAGLSAAGPVQLGDLSFFHRERSIDGRVADRASFPPHSRSYSHSGSGRPGSLHSALSLPDSPLWRNALTANAGPSAFPFRPVSPPVLHSAPASARASPAEGRHNQARSAPAAGSPHGKLRQESASVSSRSSVDVDNAVATLALAGTSWARSWTSRSPLDTFLPGSGGSTRLHGRRQTSLSGSTGSTDAASAKRFQLKRGASVPLLESSNIKPHCGTSKVPRHSQGRSRIRRHNRALHRRVLGRSQSSRQVQQDSSSSDSGAESPSKVPTALPRRTGMSSKLSAAPVSRPPLLSQPQLEADTRDRGHQSDSSDSSDSDAGEDARPPAPMSPWSHASQGRANARTTSTPHAVSTSSEPTGPANFTLAALLRAVTTNAHITDLVELSSIVAQQVCSLLAADGCFLFVLDPHQQALWCPECPSVRMTVGEGAVGVVAATQVSVSRPSVQPEKDTTDAEESTPAPAGLDNDQQAQLNLDINARILGVPLGALLCVPVQSPDDGELLGVLLALRSPHQRDEIEPIGSSSDLQLLLPSVLGAFSAQDLATLQLLSVHVGVSVRNIKLYQAAWHLHCRYSCLAQLVREMSLTLLDGGAGVVDASSGSEPTPPLTKQDTPERQESYSADEDSKQPRSFVPWVLQVVQELVRAERCSLFLVDEGTDQLWARDQRSGDDILLPSNCGLMGYAAKHKCIVNVANVAADPRATRTVDVITGDTTVSLLCAPIMDERGVVIAVTSFANKRPPDTDPTDSNTADHLNSASYASAGFTTDDEDLVRTFTSLCSTGLRVPVLLHDNQRLHQKVAALEAIAELVASAPYATEEPSSVTIQLPVGQDGRDNTPSVSDEDVVAPNVVMSRLHIVSSRDSDTESSDVAAKQHLAHRTTENKQKSRALSPEPTSPQSCSADTSYRSSPAAPVSRDGREPVRSRPPSLRRPPSNQSFTGLAQALGKTLAQSIRGLMEQAQMMLSADRCSLFLVDHHRGELYAQTRDRFQIRFPVTIGIAGAVACTGKPLNVPDVASDSRWNPDVDRVTMYQTKSVLCVPVFDGGQQQPPGPCFAPSLVAFDVVQDFSRLLVTPVTPLAGSWTASSPAHSLNLSDTNTKATTSAHPRCVAVIEAINKLDVDVSFSDSDLHLLELVSYLCSALLARMPAISLPPPSPGSLHATGSPQAAPVTMTSSSVPPRDPTRDTAASLTASIADDSAVPAGPVPAGHQTRVRQLGIVPLGGGSGSASPGQASPASHSAAGSFDRAKTRPRVFRRSSSHSLGAANNPERLRGTGRSAENSSPLMLPQSAGPSWPRPNPPASRSHHSAWTGGLRVSSGSSDAGADTNIQLLERQTSLGILSVSSTSSVGELDDHDGDLAAGRAQLQPDVESDTQVLHSTQVTRLDQDGTNGLGLELFDVQGGSFETEPPVSKPARRGSNPAVSSLLERVAVFGQQTYEIEARQLLHSVWSDCPAPPTTPRGDATVSERKQQPRHKHFGKLTHLFDFEEPHPQMFTVQRHLAFRSAVDVDNIRSFGFNSLELDRDQLMSHLVFMFEDLSLTSLSEGSETDGWAGLPLPKLCTLVGKVHSSYRTNPYHNFAHAVDATQAVYALLCTSGTVRQCLSKLDQIALMTAAFCHDLDHPGVNNDFLIKTQSPLAVFYNDSSVLESYHCSVAFLILREHGCDVFAGMPSDDRVAVRRRIIAAIMATDMTQHSHHIRSMEACMSQTPLTEATVTDADRHLLCCVSMKCADLSHLIRPFPVARAWEELLCAEFFTQGDMEAQRGLPVTPSMNRKELNVPTSQVWFYRNLGRPLFAKFCELVPDMAGSWLRTMDANCEEWRRRCHTSTSNDSNAEQPR